jgi:hypothetical protein
MRFAKVLCLVAVCSLVAVGLSSISVGVCHHSAVTPAPHKPRMVVMAPPRSTAADAPKTPEKPPVPDPPKPADKAPVPQTKKSPEKAPAAEQKAPPPLLDGKTPPPVVEVPAPDPLPPGPVETKRPDPKGPPWTVVGRGADPQSADETALEKARDKVIVHLRSQDPPIEWQPSLGYVRQNLVPKDRPQPTKVEDVILGTVYEQTLKVEVDDKHLRDMVDMDRQERMQERQLLLAKILGGILAVLTAVFGYYKLDEVTKGYYTGWLRVAAIVLIAAVGATLFFVA